MTVDVQTADHAPASTDSVSTSGPDVACAALTAERLVAARAPETMRVAPCFGVRADVAGRYSIVVPDDGLQHRIDLARGRLEVGLWGLGPAQVRVAFSATRSGGSTGYIGIDGEAFVPTIPLAEARIDGRRFGISGAVGIVDDVWVMTVEPGWSLRPIAPTYAEDRQIVPRSDLGGWFGWTSPHDFASVTVGATSGEGANLRERNEGKDVSGTITVRPLARTDLPVRLTLAGHARYGTRGLTGTRNHRFAGAVQVEHAWAAGGLEAMAADGFEGDALLRPAGGSVWLRTGPASPAMAWLRVDVHDANRDTPDDAAWTWRLGGGPRIRAAQGHAPIVALIGYEGTRYAPFALPIASVEPTFQHTLWLQLGVQLEVGAPATLMRGTLERPGR